jgi:exonuclease 3'-5' domain-containing protein 1
MGYTFCTAEPHLAPLIAALEHSGCVVLNCEGRALGMRGGAVSIISFGTMQGEIFLIDTIKIPRVTFAWKRLVAVLDDPNIHKVMWGGRLGAITLRDAYGATLAGVLDMQVAEVASRKQRGETDEERLKRLSVAVGNRAQSLPAACNDIHLLESLEECMKTLKIGTKHETNGS